MNCCQARSNGYPDRRAFPAGRLDHRPARRRALTGLPRDPVPQAVSPRTTWHIRPLAAGSAASQAGSPAATCPRRALAPENDGADILFCRVVRARRTPTVYGKHSSWFSPVGLDYWIWLGQPAGLGSSLSDLFRWSACSFAVCSAVGWYWPGVRCPGTPGGHVHGSGVWGA
jgi:hypothetical protein